MFRVEFFCDDRRLAAALHALVGIAVGKPNIEPVANVEKAGKTVRAKLNGNLPEMLQQYLKEHHLKQVDAAGCRAFCKEVGLSERSYSHVLSQSRDAGVLRKTGKGQRTVWVLR